MTEIHEEMKYRKSNNVIYLKIIAINFEDGERERERISYYTYVL